MGCANPGARSGGRRCSLLLGDLGHAGRGWGSRGEAGGHGRANQADRTYTQALQRHHACGGAFRHSIHLWRASQSPLATLHTYAYILPLSLEEWPARLYTSEQ